MIPLPWKLIGIFVVLGSLAGVILFQRVTIADLKTQIAQSAVKAKDEKIQFQTIAAVEQGKMQNDLNEANQHALDDRKKREAAESSAAAIRDQLRVALSEVANGDHGPGLPATGNTGPGQSRAAATLWGVAESLDQFAEECSREVERLGDEVRYMLVACRHGCRTI